MRSDYYDEPPECPEDAPIEIDIDEAIKTFEGDTRTLKLAILMLDTREMLGHLVPQNGRQRRVIDDMLNALDCFLPNLDRALDPTHDWQPFCGSEGIVKSAKCARCETVRLRDIFDTQYLYATPDGHGSFRTHIGEEQACGGDPE